ncbi:MAG: type II toxin-antitoxin system PemK/MazF family toxin [Clostridia bacterium]|nr:type II toxin-antitoxin system PemK/MazF family toxin [Clostridia bacterium]
MNIKRGDIYYADLSPVIGSEQGGLRPVLIVQNDVGNKFSPTVIAAAITSKIGKTKLPTHIDVLRGAQGCMEMGLARDSVILLEQIRTIDKRRLKERMGHLEDNVMQKVNAALSVSFGLNASAQVDQDEARQEIQATAAVVTEVAVNAVIPEG